MKYTVIGTGEIPDLDRLSEQLNRESWEVTAARMIAAWEPLHEAMNARNLDADEDMEILIVDMRKVMSEAVQRRAFRPGTLVQANSLLDRSTPPKSANETHKP
jgi:hypothetical protein